MGAVTGLAGPQGGATGGALGQVLGGTVGPGAAGGVFGPGAFKWTGGGSNPLGTMLGTSGGAGGTGFAKPQLAGIQAPLTPEQVQGMQGTANTGVTAQQQLATALAGGANNLQAVYGKGQTAFNQVAGLGGAGTMGKATTQQQALLDALTRANGIGKQTDAYSNLGNVYGQQGALAGQLSNIAAGRGPNPAQAMLNQATGANVANQAALMAGQRGAGANVGLMARQAAQQGAATQQQAVGQGATMQANQSLGALGQLGAQQQAMAGTAGQMAGIGQGLTGAQQGAIGQLYGQGAGTLGAQQSAFGQMAGVAGQQQANALGAQSAATNAAIGNAGQGLGASTAFNQAQVANQGNVNTGNAGLAQTGMQGQQGMIGGLMNGAGAALGMAGGGEVPDAQSAFGRFMQAYGQNAEAPSGAPLNSQQQVQQGASSLGKGIVKKLRQPGAPPEGTMAGGDVADLGTIPMTAAGGGDVDMRGGGKVDARGAGEQAAESGDSYANDKIPAMLSEDEIVLPRSVTMGANAPEAAAKFVAAVQAKRGRKMMAEAGDPAEAPEAQVAPQPTQQQQAAAPVIDVRAPDALQMPRIVMPNQQELDAENDAQAQDLATGRIKPMSYGDAAEKHSLGKIGTIFGLLLSGAGSGLSHQPNALLDMMNKEVERDYNAQVKSQENKQNWYRLSLEHTRQKYENALTQSQTKLTGAEKNVQDQVAGREALATGLNMFRMQQMGVNIQKFINGLPPGATKEQAQVMFETQVKPYIGQQNQLTNAKAVGQAGLIHAAHQAKNPQTKPQGPTADNPVDLKKVDALYRAYQMGKGLPGGETPGVGFDKADVDAAGKEAAAVKELFTAQKHVTEAFEDLDRSAAAGELTPGKRETILADLKPILAKLAGSNSVTEMERVAKNFPEPKDMPSVRSDKAKQLHGLFARALSGLTPTLGRMQARSGVGKLIADLPPPPKVAKGREAAPEQRIMGVAEDVARGATHAVAKSLGVEQVSSKPPANAKEGDTWKNAQGIEYKREHGGWRKAK